MDKLYEENFDDNLKRKKKELDIASIKREIELTTDLDFKTELEDDLRLLQSNLQTSPAVKLEGGYNKHNRTRRCKKSRKSRKPRKSRKSRKPRKYRKSKKYRKSRKSRKPRKYRKSRKNRY